MTQIIRRHNHEEFQNCSLLERIYKFRGVTAEEELQKSLHYLLPFSELLNIQKAVELLETALQQQKNIVIIGDFDADGATSTALAYLALKTCGAKNVSFLVPNRFEYGYGLSPEIVLVAAKKNAELIVTVDNGISSFEGVLAAKSLGIKVLITDHHLAASQLPQADAIVNPNQPDDQFSAKNLAGVGVIFYVMLALRSHLREKNWFQLQNIDEPNMAQFLDLVALGTVADVVVLDKINRILVHQGMQRIRGGKARLGINTLFEITGRDKTNATTNDLGFALAPRLNAAGRLEDMTVGIELLISDNAQIAHDIAIKLDTLNRERQAIEGEMQQNAREILEHLHFNKNIPLGICLFNETWHQGVIGILASRIKDQYHRPVIIFAVSNEYELKGSGRSIFGVHLRDVLANIHTHYPNLIKKFGGHAMAAGLTIEKNNYQAFNLAFNEEVQRHVKPEDLEGKIISDGPLNHEEFSLNSAEILRSAGPWGQGFPEPLFDNEFFVCGQRLVGQRHLKLILSLQKNIEPYFDGIAFNIDINQWPNHRCDKIHAAYRLDINEFRNRRNLQLLIHYLKPL